MTADDRPDKTALIAAFHRVTLPLRYARRTDQARVQWALDRATRALERLSLECTIAEAHRTEADARATAKRNRELAVTLGKLRGDRHDQQVVR